ncbi:hypothetical protein RRG08_013928 [Elysia crispata]|uniref:Parvovirus non-structural protein 1 helicase domain-containing protein n=1 Tax=Elysia crispata TaxID=231223 RepID=A0AAE1DWU5_9GAST|nr:hypothetical protein RRG08_013928 [Elysia crispata]
MYEAADDDDDEDNDDEDDEDDHQEELIIAVHDDDNDDYDKASTSRGGGGGGRGTTATKKPITDYLRQPPTKKPKRSKNLIMLDELKAAMLRHPHCATFPELVAAARGTPDYDMICNCYLDARSEKLWALARDDISPPDTAIALMGCLDALSDDLPNTLTPEQTLALFNSWCCEQNINAHKLAWFIISRMQGRVHKKIGLYLQGASNSGKTYWTSQLFSPLSSMTGKMSTGGRFCLQDCERRRIVIGEEVGITTDNVDRIKELMSGEVTTCERKGRSVVKCKASLVLMNSNGMPGANVPNERQALLNRMMLIRNLKPSNILPTALAGTTRSKPHPKFLTLVAPPTDAELAQMERGEMRTTQLLQTKGPHPRTYLFQDSWEHFLIDNVHGIGTTPPTFTLNASTASVIEIPSPDDALLEALYEPTLCEQTNSQMFYTCESQLPNTMMMTTTTTTTTTAATTTTTTGESYITPYPPSPYSMPSCLLEYQQMMQTYSVDDLESSIGAAVDEAIRAANTINMPTTTTTTDATTTTTMMDKESQLRTTVLVAESVTYQSTLALGDPCVFLEDMYYVSDDFGLTSDMGVMHRDASEEFHHGTTVEYVATISGQDDIHLMSIRVPQLYKYNEAIHTIHFDMSQYLVTVTVGDTIYVRTTAAMHALPQRPCMVDAAFTGSELQDLRLLFFMLANAPRPLRPVYRKFEPVLKDRSNLYSQWPIARTIVTDMDILNELEEANKASLTAWRDQQHRPIRAIDHTKHTNNNNNNNTSNKEDCVDGAKEREADDDDNDDDDNSSSKTTSCFGFTQPTIDRLLDITERLIKGTRIALRMTHLFASIIRRPYARHVYEFE